MSDLIFAGGCTVLVSFATILRLNEGRVDIVTGIFAFVALLWIYNFTKELLEKFGK